MQTETNRHDGTIGSLERLAGVSDRDAFWQPYARFADGLDRGVAELRRRANLPPR